MGYISLFFCCCGVKLQVEIEKKKFKKMAEQKKAVDTRLDQEMNRNTELQKEMYRWVQHHLLKLLLLLLLLLSALPCLIFRRKKHGIDCHLLFFFVLVCDVEHLRRRLRTLLKTAKKKLRDQNSAGGSPMSTMQMDFGRNSQADGGLGRMREKVCKALWFQYARPSLRDSQRVTNVVYGILFFMSAVGLRSETVFCLSWTIFRCSCRGKCLAAASSSRRTESSKISWPKRATATVATSWREVRGSWRRRCRTWGAGWRLLRWSRDRLSSFAVMWRRRPVRRFKGNWTRSTCSYRYRGITHCGEGAVVWIRAALSQIPVSVSGPILHSNTRSLNVFVIQWPDFQVFCTTSCITKLRLYLRDVSVLFKTECFFFSFGL